MKLAGFLPVLLAIPALAQSSTLHGTRIGQIHSVSFDESREGTPDFTRIADGSRIFTLPSRVNGPHAEFETWVEQHSRDYAESVLTGFTGIERALGKTTIHRFIRDNFRHADFTYTVMIEAIPRMETFQVVFIEASMPYPVPQIVREGETISLNLAVDKQTGRRMIDYIRVGTGVLHARQEVARDVYAEDAEMTITRPRLRSNGVEHQGSGLSATVSGAVLWVDIPGHGRYDLSFKPRADQGFEKAGEVADRSLVFTHGGNIFRIDCADRIATGSGTYAIYARRDPAADPNPASFAAGALP